MIHQLNHRLSQSDIHELCALTQGGRNNSLKEQLYQLTLDDDRRVATNALWVFTHFALADNEWLYAKHDQLIDRCLNEKDATKLRLMLNLLLRQPFDEEAIRTDFIDFCLTRLADPKSPYAVRAQCIKLAYEQMRYWPELLLYNKVQISSVYPQFASSDSIRCKRLWRYATLFCNSCFR